MQEEVQKTDRTDLVTDTKGVIVYANLVAAMLTGSKTWELKKNTIFELQNPDVTRTGHSIDDISSRILLLDAFHYRPLPATYQT